MAAGDIALRLLVTGNAAGAINAVTGFSGAIRGTVAGIGNGLGNLAFGFHNLGLSGTIGLDAIRLGLAQVGQSLLVFSGIASVVLATLAVALGVVAAKAAGNFQQGLERLKTGAGDVTDNLVLMGQQTLRISTDTGVVTDQLNAAMYQIISSGERGSQALDTLGVSARGAQIEQAKIVDVAKALTTAMTDYGTSQFNATAFMNGYIVATQRGKLSLEQLATSMGPILPIAQNLGISFADVAGAMATMTNAGIPAERSATSLRFLFQSLETPTHKASAAMQAFGLDSVALANELKVSLPGALQMVYDAAKKAGPAGSVPFNRAVSDMVGGQRSLQAYLSLTGTHLQAFSANAKAVSDAMSANKSGVLGWQTALANFNIQVARGKAAIGAFLIQLGTQVMPIFQELMVLLMPIVIGFLNWITSSGILRDILQAVVDVVVFLVDTGTSLVAFFQQNELAMDALKATLGLLAVVISVAIVAALYSAAAATWVWTAALLANPLTWIVLAIIAVITLVILAVQHWGEITKWLGDAAQTVITAVGGWFSWLGSVVHGFVTDVKNTVGGWFSWLGTQAHNAVTTVGGWFSWLGSFVHDFAIGAINAVLGFFTWLYNHNYYIKDMVDGLVAGVKAVGAFFDWLGTHTKAVLDGVGSHVGGFFSWLGTSAHSGVNTVGGWFDWLGTHASAIWTPVRTTAGNFFSWLGTQAHGGATTVGSWFDWLGTHVKGVWDTVRNGIGGFFSWLGSFVNSSLSNIGTIMLQAGKNFMAMLGQGIASGAHAVIDAATNIAQQIAKLLGFHSPTEEGPGRTSDQWAPALVGMYSQGLAQGAAQINAAVLTMMQPLSLLNMGTRGASGISWTPQNGATLATQGSFAVRGSGAPNTPIVIQPAPVYLDKRKVGDILFTYQATEVRRQGGIRNT